MFVEIKKPAGQQAGSSLYRKYCMVVSFIYIDYITELLPPVFHNRQFYF